MDFEDGIGLTFSYKGSVFQSPGQGLYPIDEGGPDYNFYVRETKSRLSSVLQKYTCENELMNCFESNPSDYLPAFIIKYEGADYVFYFNSPIPGSESRQNSDSEEAARAFFANLKELVAILKQYHKQLEPATTALEDSGPERD